MAAASIISGAVAERMRFMPYLIFTAVVTGLFYPLVGHWVWGSGWLSKLGMMDFAGSAVIHALGGFSALAAVRLLGPRRGSTILTDQ